MSPTARETVPNRALSGDELKRLILEDFDRLVAQEGILSTHIAFGRVAYDLILRIHVDNPFAPEFESHTGSRSAAVADIAKDESLAAVEPAPLTSPSDKSKVRATKLSRSIDSPNVERLRTGQPIPVERRQQDGTTITEQISYPRDDSAADDSVTVADDSAAAKQKWGILDDVTAVALEPSDRPANSSSIPCGHTYGDLALSGICAVCGTDINAAKDDSNGAWLVKGSDE